MQRYHPHTIDLFAEQVLHKPFYPYQREIVHAILSSIYEKRGDIFTIMMARQSGKNQLSAVLEAFLLASSQQGTIVKAAPTYQPQIVNSRLRLLSLLQQPGLRQRVWQSYGHIVGLAPTSERALVKGHVGPRVMFFSAAPESNVVGATADLLLEIDEAQDVSCEKFDRDFHPMSSTCNTTTVLYGTAWTDDTLLAQQRAVNLALEQQGGRRRHFEYDWHTLAAINPAYRTFVEREIERLGENHVAIQTQYLLRPLQGADYLLNPLQRVLLQGEHDWQSAPESETWYVAGLDVAGEELAGSSTSSNSTTQRDSTVFSIARLRYNELGLPLLEVVHQHCWTGMIYQEQYAATLALVKQWGIRTLVIDATGIGAGLASFLLNALGQERVIPFTFSRSSKSRLAYQLLSMINSGRCKLYRADQAPAALYQECWRQLSRARYRLPAPSVLDIYVDPSEGHDDFLISLALLTEAAAACSMPAASTLLKPRHLYEEYDNF